MKKQLLLGALAGALGGLAMKAVVRLLDPASFGLSEKTDAAAAHQVWRRLGWEPVGQCRAARLGAGMHYAFSVGAGALYAGVAGRIPLLRAGRGTAFGVGLWLIGDEIAVSAAGLEDPRNAPLASHMSALGAHLLYGLMVDAVIP